MTINTITYNSAISALAKAARSESKQQRRYDYKQITASKIGVYKPAALKKPNNSDLDFLWRRALDLIECMEKEGVRRDSFTYSSAISTCGAAGQWQEAVNLIKAMKEYGGEDTRPNRVAYTSAISECHYAFVLIKKLNLLRISLLI